MIETPETAREALEAAWPQIQEECLSVLGSELHYQAMIYHALRTSGNVPLRQLGMNVKQSIRETQTELFKARSLQNQPGYQEGFEPIPDVVIFSAAVDGDWRRRSASRTLRCMLAAIEVKASERAGKRLAPGEILGDIRKLAAHREEVQYLGTDFYPVMLVVDSAREPSERMTDYSLREARGVAQALSVEWRYLSPTDSHVLAPTFQTSET